MGERAFPKDFIWGTATASYQIEGAGQEDGRTPCIWDMFAALPGKVYGNHNGDTACDHYHRFKEDIALMKELGFQSYRFSIAWPRIFPERGQFNPKGLDFYKRVLEELSRQGLKPAATIYHWDLPMWLYELGGWVNRDVVNYFEEYAGTLFDQLGKDIPMWITHNEPWCAAFLGYGMGVHAPGHENWQEALMSAHHMLLSHGKVVEAYRRSGLQGQIGITLNLSHMDPASDRKEDVDAAYRSDGFTNRWFLDPVLKGSYPEDMKQLFGQAGATYDFIQDGDLEIISTPSDFLGINYYTRQILQANPEDRYMGLRHVRGDNPHTDMDWEVYPEGLYFLLKRLQADYGDIPLYVTENGAAYPDVWDGKEEVADDERIRYFDGHLDAAQRFIQEGGNLKGYYCWSFMDNYEWAFGYSKRFGIVYVDYLTQRRVPKKSALWFRDQILK